MEGEGEKTRERDGIGNGIYPAWKRVCRAWLFVHLSAELLGLIPLSLPSPPSLFLLPSPVSHTQSSQCASNQGVFASIQSLAGVLALPLCASSCYMLCVLSLLLIQYQKCFTRLSPSLSLSPLPFSPSPLLPSHIPYSERLTTA